MNKPKYKVGDEVWIRSKRPVIKKCAVAERKEWINRNLYQVEPPCPHGLRDWELFNTPEDCAADYIHMCKSRLFALRSLMKEEDVEHRAFLWCEKQVAHYQKLIRKIRKRLAWLK